MNRYPLWRYILLVVLIVLGVLYAAPNLFGEDPAIEISAKNTQPVTQTVVSTIKTALKKEHLTYRSIQIQPHNVLIRFHTPTTQLKAQDVITATIGDTYTVALNLAPRTPAWLLALGAHPMKLGLDLRGGVHFLLAVDVDAMLKTRQAGDMHSMGDQLRTAGIRYSGMKNQIKNGLLLDFRTQSDTQKALQLLSSQFPNYQFKTINQNDNHQLAAIISPNALIKIEDYALDQNMTTLRNRVNALGVSEAIVQRQGADHIRVDLPGIQDTARAKDMIGKVATIRFQLVDTEHDAATATATGIIPFGSQLYHYQGRPVLLKNQVILRGDSITHASATVGNSGRPAVSIRLGGGGETLFSRITAENIGKPLAAVYVETRTDRKMQNGKVVTTHRQVNRIISVATIQNALGGNFQITNLDSERYAANLSLQLRSGAYSAPVSFVQERLIGPSLGEANIHTGLMSMFVASVLIVVFMAIYYRVFGLIADMALLLNLVFIAAVMSLIGATMTLPGMAAIVLTMGMAVDANVLINERIREELRLGITPQAAIHTGYGRAFSTIVDANVTTLIVAVVLFALGSSSVKGFAVSLIIGLITSMITAIFFTRAVVNLTYGMRQIKWLSIGIKQQDAGSKLEVRD